MTPPTGHPASPSPPGAPPWERRWRGGPPWRGGPWRGGPWRGGPWRGGPWRGGPWRDPRRLSLGLPALVALIQVWGCAAAQPGPLQYGHLDGLGYALLLIGPAALIWRRISPLATLAVALPATYVYLAAGYPRGPYFLAAFIAIVTAASRARRAAVWVITGVSFLLVVGSVLQGQSYSLDLGDVRFLGVGDTTAVLTAAWTGFALVLGEAVRAQRERMVHYRRARAEADRAKGEQTRRQASDERLRIARELHDVLGHHLSLINVRAGVALHLLDTEPAQARDALSAIKLASAEALREVRGVLATLTPRDESAPRAPAQGLDAIEELVSEAEAAGTPVRTVHTGDARPLPGEVERAAYRIVREALTNVRRHAGPGVMVTVTIGYTTEGLTVRVEDTGAGPAESTAPDGNGIAGMRERATALGGWLRAGGGAGGVGYEVEAFLPVSVEDARPDPWVGG